MKVIIGMNGKLFGDRPIRTPTDDLFGLSSFSNALATSLLTMSPKEGLVISVEAPWGAGKSSAIGLALRVVQIRELVRVGESIENLEKLSPDALDDLWTKKAKKRATHIVRFNPWNFSGQENLVRAFFKELESQVGVKTEGKIAKAISRVADYLPSAMGGLAGVSALAVGNTPVASAAVAGGRAAGETAERLLKQKISLEQAKRDLANALRDADKRIIVVIDDIDRLLPSEMRSILSLVKSLGDLPNVLYLLAFDEKVVTTALSQGAEKLDPNFLEKIVQVSLKLPPPWREELRGLFFTRLNAIIGDAKAADEQRWRHMFVEAIDPYLETPRDVIRLANTLQVIWPNIAGDVDLTDLIAVTTLQLFESNIYKKIAEEIEIITGAQLRFEEDKEFGKRFEPVSAHKPEAAKEALSRMFPRLSRAWNAHTYDGSDDIVNRDQRRICTVEYYRNYFLFGRDGRRLSKSEINSLLVSKEPLVALRTVIDRLGKAEAVSRQSAVGTMLEQLIESVATGPRLVADFVCAILDVSDELIRREDLTWELSARTNHERLCNLLEWGLEPLTPSERAALLDVLVRHKTGLQLRSHIILRCARQHGLFGGKPSLESEQLFPKEEIETVAHAIGDQIKALIFDGTIWTTRAPIFLIRVFCDIAGKEALEPWFAQALRDDNLILGLANALPHRSFRSSSNKGQEIVWVFKRENYSNCFDIEALMNRLEVLALESPAAKEALNRLTKAEEKANDW